MVIDIDIDIDIDEGSTILSISEIYLSENYNEIHKFDQGKSDSAYRLINIKGNAIMEPLDHVSYSVFMNR